MDPQQRRGEIFDALRHVILGAAAVCPQVVVFEDLQWMDQATQDFLGFFMDSVPTARVLCLLTYRTGYAQPFGERTYHTRLTLTTLSSPDSLQMAQALLLTDSLPAALQTLITQRAEGNPFFVEEIIKTLQDTGRLARARSTRCSPGPSRRWSFLRRFRPSSWPVSTAWPKLPDGPCSWPR